MNATVERILALIKEKHISKNKFCKDVGINPNSIVNWINRDTTPSSTALGKIALYFDVPVDYLLGVRPEPSIIPLDNSPVSIPVYESVSAGLGAYADNKIVGYTSVYLRNVNIGEIIAAKVVGDSMYPYICDGDTVIIRKNAEINNGDVAVILIDDEAVVKKVKLEPDKLTLISFNPEYQDRVFTAAEADRIKIIGKVISSQKNW